MNVADYQTTTREDGQYWIKLTNKLYNKAFAYCNHQCKVRNNPADIKPCYDYCYDSYMVEKKVAMHQAQDGDNFHFNKCLAKSGTPGDLNTIFECSQKVHASKMLVAADHIEKT